MKQKKIVRENEGEGLSGNASDSLGNGAISHSNLEPVRSKIFGPASLFTPLILTRNLLISGNRARTRRALL